MTSFVQPVQADERNKLIDVLRGFALLGVLIANLASFVTYALTDDMQKHLITTAAGKVSEGFISLLVENKFITLFSLLFGYGFGVIIDRTASKGISAIPFFMRRMSFLLVLGLAHLGIWWGEILSTYALCGFLLLLFRKASDRVLLISGAGLLFIIVPGIQAIRWGLLPNPTATIDVFQRQYFEAVRSGDLGLIVKYNYKAADLFFLHRYSQLRDMAEILAKFLLGYYILRKGFFSKQPSIAWMRKAWKVCLPVALVYMTEHLYVLYSGIVLKGLPVKLTLFTFDKLGVLCLSGVYALTIAFLYRSCSKALLFKYFEAIGRMSLTNYLTHTVFYVFIYYGIGFGLLGSIHLQWTIPLALAIYTLQVMFSIVWLNPMMYGPAEWVWRQVTYGKRLGLRKARINRSSSGPSPRYGSPSQ